MLFVPFVRVSLLTMAARQIYEIMHLQRSHSSPYARDSGRPKVDSILKVQMCSPARSKIQDNLIIGLTICNLRPVTMIEGRRFQELMEYYEPGCTVPLRKHLSKLMFDQITSGKALLTKTSIRSILTLPHNRYMDK